MCVKRQYQEMREEKKKKFYSYNNYVVEYIPLFEFLNFKNLTSPPNVSSSSRGCIT